VAKLFSPPLLALILTAMFGRNTASAAIFYDQANVRCDEIIASFDELKRQEFTIKLIDELVFNEQGNATPAILQAITLELRRLVILGSPLEKTADYLAAILAVPQITTPTRTAAHEILMNLPPNSRAEAETLVNLALQWIEHPRLSITTESGDFVRLVRRRVLPGFSSFDGPPSRHQELRKKLFDIVVDSRIDIDTSWEAYAGWLELTVSNGILAPEFHLDLWRLVEHLKTGKPHQKLPPNYLYKLFNHLLTYTGVDLERPRHFVAQVLELAPELVTQIMPRLSRSQVLALIEWEHLPAKTLANMVHTLTEFEHLKAAVTRRTSYDSLILVGVWNLGRSVVAGLTPTQRLALMARSLSKPALDFGSINLVLSTYSELSKPGELSAPVFEKPLATMTEFLLQRLTNDTESTTVQSDKSYIENMLTLLVNLWVKKGIKSPESIRILSSIARHPQLPVRTAEALGHTLLAIEDLSIDTGPIIKALEQRDPGIVKRLIRQGIDPIAY